MNTIGERLKEWRKSNKLTLVEVAKKAEISQGALSDAENNKKVISSTSLISLWRKYDIDIQYILTGTKSSNFILTENQKEMLEYFDNLPEREQIKFIGKIEEIAKQYSNKGKSSNSKIG